VTLGGEVIIVGSGLLRRMSDPSSPIASHEESKQKSLSVDTRLTIPSRRATKSPSRATPATRSICYLIFLSPTPTHKASTSLEVISLGISESRVTKILPLE